MVKPEATSIFSQLTVTGMEKLEGAVQKKLVGSCLANIREKPKPGSTLKVPFKPALMNAREVDMGEVEKLQDSFESGIYRKRPSNFLPVLATDRMVDFGALSKNFRAGEALAELSLRPEFKELNARLVHFAGGRHRQTAVVGWVEKAAASLTEMSNDLEKLASAKDVEGKEQYKRIQQRIAEVTQEVSLDCMWGVNVYDLGE